MPDEGFEAEVRQALREGVDLFNRGRYWETHEVLERVWLRDRPPRKTFLQGLIKVAAGYHHFRNGNWLGMHNLLTAGREALQSFSPAYMGVDLEALLDEVEYHGEWARQAMAQGAQINPVVPPRLVLQS